MSESISLDIVNDGYSYETLLKSIYERIEVAVIRELVRNALDAHAEAGIERKIDFDLTDNIFYVRDYGNGISHDDVKELMSVVMKSSKRGNSSTTGGHGLGCKTPFGLMYSGKNNCQAIMASVHAGVKNVYELRIDNGMPCYDRVVTNEITNEESGVSYLIEVDERIRFVSMKEYIKLFYPMIGKVNFLGIDFSSYLHIEKVCGVDIVALKQHYVANVDGSDTVNSPWQYIEPVDDSKCFYNGVKDEGSRVEFNAIRGYAMNVGSARRGVNFPFDKMKGDFAPHDSLTVYIDGIVYDVPALRMDVGDAIDSVLMEVKKTTQQYMNHAVFNINEHNINSDNNSERVKIDVNSLLVIVPLDSWYDIEANRSRESIVHLADSSPDKVVDKVYKGLVNNAYPWYKRDVLSSLKTNNICEAYFSSGFSLFHHIMAWDVCISLIASRGPIKYDKDVTNVVVDNPHCAIMMEALKVLSTLSWEDTIDSIMFDKSYRAPFITEMLYSNNISFYTQRFNDGDIFRVIENVMGAGKLDAFNDAINESFPGISDQMRQNIKGSGCTRFGNYFNGSPIHKVTVEGGKIKSNIDLGEIFIRTESPNVVFDRYFVSTVYVRDENENRIVSGNSEGIKVGNSCEFFLKDSRVYKQKVEHYMRENHIDVLVEVSYKGKGSGTTMVEPEVCINDVLTGGNGYDSIFPDLIAHSIAFDRPLKKGSDIFDFVVPKSKKSVSKRSAIKPNVFGVKSVDSKARGVSIQDSLSNSDQVSYKSIIDLYENNDVVYWIDAENEIDRYNKEEEYVRKSYWCSDRDLSVICCDLKTNINRDMVTSSINKTVKIRYNSGVSVAFITTACTASKKVINFVNDHEKTRPYREYMELVVDNGVMVCNDSEELLTSGYDLYLKKIQSIVMVWACNSSLDNFKSWRIGNIGYADLHCHAGYALAYYLNKVHGIGNKIEETFLYDHGSMNINDMDILSLYVSDKDKYNAVIDEIRKIIDSVESIVESIKVNNYGTWRTWEYFEGSVNRMMVATPRLQVWRKIREDVDSIFINKNC